MVRLSKGADKGKTGLTTCWFDLMWCWFDMIMIWLWYDLLYFLLVNAYVGPYSDLSTGSMDWTPRWLVGFQHFRMVWLLFDPRFCRRCPIMSWMIYMPRVLVIRSLFKKYVRNCCLFSQCWVQVVAVVRHNCTTPRNPNVPVEVHFSWLNLSFWLGVIPAHLVYRG